MRRTPMAFPSACRQALVAVACGMSVVAIVMLSRPVPEPQQAGQGLPWSGRAPVPAPVSGPSPAGLGGDAGARCEGAARAPLAAAVRPTEIVLRNVPRQLVEHFVLTAHVVGHAHAGVPLTPEIPAAIEVAAAGSRVLVVAEHARTGWRQELAERWVEAADDRVVIDLAHDLRALSCSSLLVRLHLPADLSGDFTVELRSQTFATASASAVAARGGEEVVPVWMHGLAPGTYEPIATALQSPWWRCTFAPVTVRGETEVELRPAGHPLSPAADLVVRLRDAEGAATSPAWLVVQDANGGAVANVQRRADVGLCTVSGLRRGDHLLQARATGLASARRLVHVGASVRALDLQLLPAGDATIHVVDLDTGTLEVAELPSGERVALPRQEERIRGRLHRIRMALPQGSYRATARRGATVRSRTFEVGATAALVMLDVEADAR